MSQRSGEQLPKMPEPNMPETPGPIAGVLIEVDAELRKALIKFPRPQTSPHEMYAVLLEELDELWDHVKANTGRSPEARKEAIQMAAMAVRYILEVCK